MAKKVAKKKVVKKAAKPKAKKVVKKAAKPKAKKATKRKGGAGGLAKMCYTLSAELSAVCGSKKLTRPEIVKKLWAYIKSHKCQDAKNRRMINPDQKLSEVIGKKPVDMLKLAGLLNKHIQ